MVSNQSFLLTEIPQFNPHSQDFGGVDGWWYKEKRKCIEGMWSGGKWMPGRLYFYSNFWKIKLTIPGQKQEIIARPFLQDLEWEKAYVVTEAKGFSGFKDDDEYTCHRLLTLPDFEQRVKFEPENIVNTLYNLKGQLKKYKPAREYLRQIFPKSLGKPLYLND